MSELSTPQTAVTTPPVGSQPITAPSMSLKYSDLSATGTGNVSNNVGDLNGSPKEDPMSRLVSYDLGQSTVSLSPSAAPTRTPSPTPAEAESPAPTVAPADAKPAATPATGQGWQASGTNNGTTDKSGKLTINGKDYAVNKDGYILDDGKITAEGYKFDSTTNKITDAKGNEVGELKNGKIVGKDGKELMMTNKDKLVEKTTTNKLKSFFGGKTFQTAIKALGLGLALYGGAMLAGI